MTTDKFPRARFDPTQPAGGRRGQYVYHDPRIVQAVNVALAVERPLFVTGLPGSGKSTLARDVAHRLDWAYLRHTVTSRTRVDDLVVVFDAVRRLADAQANALKDDAYYLRPGPLWWAFDPDSANRLRHLDSRSWGDPREGADKARNGTVLLLDEIDKAEPDLPNDLLEPLDDRRIRLPGQTTPVTATRQVLIVITSNEERDMPPAFLRRCVVLRLRQQSTPFLVAVAESHLGRREDTLYRDVAERMAELARLAREEGQRRPSTAEYLDTVQACIEYQQWPPGKDRDPSPLWAAIEETALSKTATGPGAGSRLFEGETGDDG